MATGLVGKQKISSTKLRMARKLRKEMTEAEKQLWQGLRRKNLNGFKFRRQQILRGYIADFYCESLSLCVEVDGEVHDSLEQKLWDEERTIAFSEVGVTVVRFQNQDVLKRLDWVLKKISDFGSGGPSPSGEGLASGGGEVRAPSGKNE